MKKIKDFMKNNKILCWVFIALFIVFLGIVVYFGFIKNDDKKLNDNDNEKVQNVVKQENVKKEEATKEESKK